MVALLTASASELGTSSRYLLTPSPKPRPALARVQRRLGSTPTTGLAIEWPVPFPGRIRKVISRSGAHRRYIVPCYRYGDAEAHGDAAEEAAAFILLDACAGIEFQEQPARFTFDWVGREHQHVPDILVATGTRCEFWECKRSSEADGFWIRKRAERMRELLLPLGVDYRVVTGEALHRGSFLANARTLRSFAKHPVSESATTEATVRTRTIGEIPLGKLAEALRGEEPTADVLALVYAGTLCADLRYPVSRRTPIRLPTTEEPESWVWQVFAPDNA